MELNLMLATALALTSSADANREAIQKAIDEASVRGGGIVTIPAGEWRPDRSN